MSKRIIIADKSTLVRRGLRAILENIISSGNHTLSLEGETDTVSDLDALLKAKPADIVIMGLRLRNCDKLSPFNELEGTRLIKYLRKNWPHMAIVVISPYLNPHIYRMIRNAGAHAFITHDNNENDLNILLESIIHGHEHGKQHLISPVCRSLYSRELLLTPRETDIINMLCQGLSGTEIAEKTKLSPKTISTQKKKAMIKLNVKNDSQLYFLLAKTQLFELML
ncbi:LuxR C-terminal-related transcriptional regulator [Pantoea sp. y20]